MFFFGSIFFITPKEPFEDFYVSSGMWCIEGYDGLTNGDFWISRRLESEFAKFCMFFVSDNRFFSSFLIGFSVLIETSGLCLFSYKNNEAFLFELSFANYIECLCIKPLLLGALNFEFSWVTEL